MKIILSALLFLLCQSAHAGPPEIFQDSFVQGDLDSLTIEEIYLSLPQEFFDLSYRKRIDSLLNGRLVIDEKNRTARLGGDGGQSTIEFRVRKQTKDSLILDLTDQLESDKSSWTLERIKNGWKVIEKNAG